MSRKLQILIAEDSAIFSEGLALVLKQKQEIGAVKIAKDDSGTLQILKHNPVDILFLDLNFEDNNFNGLTIAHEVRQLYPQIKIIVLTQHARVYLHEKLFKEYKVDAYLDKQSETEEIYSSITQVMQGKKYIDPNISKILQIEQWMKLSKRETEIVQFLIKGLTQKEIADLLHISPRTVERHVNNVLKRLGLKNSVELTAKYLEYINRTREDNEGFSFF